ncbi:SDR family oxidoreductase [Burkholderia plantarii]|uniref:SDR family oxidoreductase n=1 Tax=Burkholderia plantarii TaxID=41899 RepID=UPI0006D8C1D2|nr:SDR family oxidoreductase [Burkholderia plantarii]ALK32362.1 Putative dehydrogenase [Burkholderia plantarii]GLZ18905.1 dehydrogenase [Burkholderia plantarii]
MAQHAPAAASSDAAPVVLVTGAARRAGRAFARRFGARGYRVAVHYDRSADAADATAREIDPAGGAAVALQADLADAAACAALVDTVYARFGRLDVLVNNASVFWQDHFPSFELDALEAAWQVNCRAPLLLARRFHDRAKAAGAQGVVINVIDQKIRDNFHRDHFSYTVAKAALGNLTQMLAMSAAPVLRVNAVFPGLMLPSDDQTEADFEHASHASTPLARIAGPDDVADAILLLTGSAYNGVDFVVDAGQNLIRVDQDVLYKHRSPAESR